MESELLELKMLNMSVGQFNQVTIEDTTSPLKCPITTRLVLETDEETKEPIIEVDKKLIRKLKPHQVDGVYYTVYMCQQG